MKRPRYSLLTLFLVMTVVCLAIPLWESRRELSQLRQEVTQRRAEMGQLFVDDENKPHAIGVEWDNSGRWTWRLYLPENIQRCLYSYVGPAPAFGSVETGQWLTDLRDLRSGSSVGGVSSGEYTFRVQFVEEYGEWFFWTEGPQWKTSIPQNFNNWLGNRNLWHPMSKVNFQDQIIFDPDEPIVLLCIQKRSNSGDASAGDTIVLWIDKCP